MFLEKFMRGKHMHLNFLLLKCHMKLIMGWMWGLGKIPCRSMDFSVRFLFIVSEIFIFLCFFAFSTSRYVLKVTINRGYAGSIIEYQDFVVCSRSVNKISDLWSLISNLLLFYQIITFMDNIVLDVVVKVYSSHEYTIPPSKK